MCDVDVRAAGFAHGVFVGSGGAVVLIQLAARLYAAQIAVAAARTLVAAMTWWFAQAPMREISGAIR